MTSHGLAHRLVAAAGTALIVAGLLGGTAQPAAADGGFKTEDMTVDSGTGADAVTLDTTLFVPNSATSSVPAASIIIAHGYGGTKEQSKGQATKFAREGYVVLTYTARGFGKSTGQVSIDSPDYEVADARTMIDLLAARPEVLQDGQGDPKVGMFGGSYGGGLVLLTAGYDNRVDAVSASRTWNSLVTSLFPNSLGAPKAGTPGAGSSEDANGVFKQLWAEFFFQGGSLDAEGGDTNSAPASGSTGSCGDNIRPEWCEAYRGVLQNDGQLTDTMKGLLEASSPASVIDNITAPTILSQGEGDTLFPLTEADANARGIAANGAPVRLFWVTGGHGATRSSKSEAVELNDAVDKWFDFYLRGQGDKPATSFDYTQVTDQAANGRSTGDAETTAQYPGLTGADTTRLGVALSGSTQQIQNPAGGDPAALSTVPPGHVAPGERKPPSEIPGQAATFDSAALTESLDVVGTPTVDVRVASSSGQAVLFAKLYDVDPSGRASLIQGLVAPVRMTSTPTSIDQAQPSTITLAAIAHRFEAGHQLRLVLASTDQGYASPAEAATYDIGLGSDTGMLGVPDLSGQPAPSFTAPQQQSQQQGGKKLYLIGVVVAVLVVLVAVVAFLLTRSRRRGRDADRDVRRTPGVPRR